MVATSPEATLASSFSVQSFEEFLARRSEPEWVAQSRRSAFDLFQERRFTPLDPEEWKRVDLRTFKPDSFRIASGSSETQFSTLMQNRAQFAGAVSHVDGACRQLTAISEELAAKGVLFGDLAALLNSHGDLLKPYLGSTVRPATDRFTAWHGAFWTGGTVLFVPKNVVLDQPLYSLIGLATSQAADFSHTLIVLESGASATLLEETVSATGDAGLHVGAVELIVGEGAHLRYVQLQNWNEKTYHFAHQAGRVARDGSLQWTVGGLGSKLAHIHQTVDLDGPGAEAQVNGVTFASDRQVLSYYTQQTHHAPNTRSDLLYKDVLRDRARVVWRGMIKVDPAAQKTDGYQRNDSLMLSESARCDAIPGLEIEADDVRCTHGATAGRVDVDQVFYLMCRGLSEYEAMHMIVKGFFQTVTDRIPVELVRETLDKAVEKKLGIGDING